MPLLACPELFATCESKDAAKKYPAGPDRVYFRPTPKNASVVNAFVNAYRPGRPNDLACEFVFCTNEETSL